VKRVTFSHQQRCRTRRWGSAVALFGIAVLFLAGSFVLLRVRVASAQGPAVDRPLTAQEIVAVFQVAGLPVENVRQQPIGMGGPSGPPTSEREAWAFTIPTVAPSGGRIMIFADGEKLRGKADWFTRVGGTYNTIAAHNVILWLDPALPASDVARYRRALQGLG